MQRSSKSGGNGKPADKQFPHVETTCVNVAGCKTHLQNVPMNIVNSENI